MSNRDRTHEGERGAGFLPRTAFELCTDVIAGPLPAAAEVPKRETLITTRWRHRELHDTMPALPVHAVATYYGPPSPRVWRCGRMRLVGTGRPGTVSVVPAELGGQWDSAGESSLSYVLLSGARLRSFAEPLTRGRSIELAPRVGELDPVGASILRVLCREAARPEPARRLQVEHGLDLLCLHLLRVHSSLAGLSIPSARCGLLPWQARRVTAHMAERLDRDVGLDDLAGLLGLSRSHFCTAFRQATGRTPHEWLTKLRMEQAQRLLHDPGARITDIALAVGYHTPSAFAAAFRRHTGATPSDYRRSL